ncbi:hypothetical protein JRO89_XS06G0151200 [Xanthoceras sorbifolium]|uniref:Uncharacterized protein n=1 Tax=Xanthoceras sorbifolium TaxID=99658 RepID=A0ABQ8HYS0_9ROSI|nr:hypothetical protein JRO89_XS06G0151200 [Xanthoceras sorbifolium]
MGRAPCCDKANVKKGPWSPEEDAKLKAYIEKYGTGNNWIALPQKIGGQDPNHDVINGGDDGQYSDQNLSNSALERLQLHMQLQNLQNPFSFYNNPALWPKLHPFQGKMVQALQSLNNQSPNNHNNNHPLMQQHVLPGSHQQKVDFYQQSTLADHDPLAFQQSYPHFSNPKVHELDNSLHGMSSSDSSIRVNNDNSVTDHSAPLPKANGLQSDTMVQPASAFQAELENFLNNKTIGYTAQEDDQISQFDCFNAVNGSKDSLIWWANEFDSKSASSNSWDSTPVLQSDGMFLDFELGYNL